MTRRAQHRSLQVRHVLRRHPALDLTLQVAIDVVGWIQLRGVRWQIEHLNSTGVLIKPLAHHLRLVNVQIAQDEEDLAACVLDPLSSKLAGETLSLPV